MTMEDRVAVLEREVVAIKSELAVMKHDLANAVELNPRVSHIELELVAISRAVKQLQKDVSQLQKDVAKLTEDVIGIRIELAKLAAEQSPYMTKADLTAFEGRMRGWMLAGAFSIMAAHFASVYPLYGALNLPLVEMPSPLQQTIR